MKEIRAVLVVLISFLMVSCSEQKAPLYVTTYDVIKKDDVDNGTKETVNYDKDYLEMTLAEFPNNAGFTTKNEIKEGRTDSDGYFRMTGSFVSDENGKGLRFSSSTEFLNFISERGYSMVTKEENTRYHTIKYTFKMN